MKKIIGKLRRLPKGVKASVGLFIANVVTSGIAYITTPIYTRLLTPDEYGQTSVFLTWMSNFGIVAMFCLSYGVFNNGMLDYKNDRDGYSFSMLVLSNIITAAFAIILFSFYPLIGGYIVDIPLLILMFAVFLTQPAYNFWTARQRYEYKYKATTFFSIASALLSPAVAVVCIITTSGSRLYARLFGALTVLIFMYILLYIYLARKSNFKVKTSYWKYALIFNLPLIPHYLSSYLLTSSDKLMIKFLVSDSATAYYSVAHSVAAIATIIWSAANASLIPYTYEKCEKKNYKAISNITTPLLVVFAAASIFVIMLAPEIIAIMATNDYLEAIYVIPPIVGGVFFQVQYFIYANIIYYYKKPRYVMYASVTAMLLNIALNYIFIKKYGYLAAGYTTIFCYLVQAILDYFAMKKVVKQQVYNMKNIGILSGIILAVALLSNLTYNFTLVRYIIIAAMLILAFVFRNKFIIIFITIKRSEDSNET